MGKEGERQPQFAEIHPDRAPKRRKETGGPNMVVYAGQSPRRIAFLRYCFPFSYTIEFSGGDEPDSADVVSIMHGKLETVLKRFHGPDRNIRQQQLALVAADTRTSTLTLNPEGTPYLESHGKPQNPEEVAELFRGIQKASLHDLNTPPYYMVTSGSGIHLKGPSGEERRLVDYHTSTVELDRVAMQHLNSQRGFRRYVRAFEDFYSKPPYTQKGDTPPVTMLDLSGGISLPVLVKMGAVVSIEGVSLTDQQFKDVLKKGIYNVAIGFSPDILRTVQPDVEQLIQRWDWLNKVVENCLTPYEK